MGSLLLPSPHTHHMSRHSGSVCTGWQDRWAKTFLNMAVTIYRHRSRDDVIAVAGRGRLTPSVAEGEEGAPGHTPREGRLGGWLVAMPPTHVHTNTHMCTHTPTA